MTRLVSIRPVSIHPARLLALAVRAYQWTLRPLIGGNCRFTPSCSDYALEALARHGALRGSLLAGRRILRCNPWVPGGLDPCPDATCPDATCMRGRTAR